MNCIVINLRAVLLIIVCFVLNGARQIQPGKFSITPIHSSSIADIDEWQKDCVKDVDLECNEIDGKCINCEPSFNKSCVYGSMLNVTCTTQSNCRVDNKETRSFTKTVLCRYCYQTETWEHTCLYTASCKSVSSPPQYYITNCTVKNEVVCLGRRSFQKRILCNWTGGYRWSTALLLSITLGGFGADRFYLGHWQEGIGKLFSFGGLGVWTLIDVILISLHYLGPADGSLYI